MDEFGGGTVHADGRHVDDEDELLVMEVVGSSMSDFEREVVCSAVAEGDAAALEVRREISEASNATVTTVEATALSTQGLPKSDCAGRSKAHRCSGPLMTPSP